MTRELYVFLRRRPFDAEAFPLVYEDRVRAEAAEWRVSDVHVVTLQEYTNDGKQSAD